MPWWRFGFDKQNPPPIGFAGAMGGGRGLPCLGVAAGEARSEPVKDRLKAELRTRLEFMRPFAFVWNFEFLPHPVHPVYPV
jgi:hypothetical protein